MPYDPPHVKDSLTRRRFMQSSVGGAVGLTAWLQGWPRLSAAPAAKNEPSGQMTWAVHVTIAPTWFDPAEVPGIVTPFMLLYALHDGMFKPITVVAKGGSFVVYDMFPHGLKFRRPVTVVQGLSTTAAYRTAKVNSVRTAYLRAGSERISAKGFAAAAELPAATTYFYGSDRIAETHEWILSHFSRYILVSGAWLEVDDPEDDQGDDNQGEGIGSSATPIDSLQAPVDSLENR